MMEEKVARKKTKKLIYSWNRFRFSHDIHKELFQPRASTCRLTPFPTPVFIFQLMQKLFFCVCFQANFCFLWIHKKNFTSSKRKSENFAITDKDAFMEMYAALIILKAIFVFHIVFLNERKKSEKQNEIHKEWKGQKKTTENWLISIKIAFLLLIDSNAWLTIQLRKVD